MLVALFLILLCGYREWNPACAKNHPEEAEHVELREEMLPVTKVHCDDSTDRLTLPLK
jgi:hypothetical protein